ncbi:UNVERIFIED_CONTAM: hypothetical protein K2H54_029461 [Gekko kuhli]
MASRNGQSRFKEKGPSPKIPWKVARVAPSSSEDEDEARLDRLAALEEAKGVVIDPPKQAVVRPDDAVGEETGVTGSIVMENKDEEVIEVVKADQTGLSGKWDPTLQ